MSSQYVTGQLVWAKLKGFPFWPARIADPTEKPGMKKPRKKNSHCVHFFGSGDYAYVAVDDMRPYFAFKDKLTPSSKKANFVEALAKVDQHVADNESVKEMEAKFSIQDDESYRRWLKETKGDDTNSDLSDDVIESGPKTKKSRLEVASTSKKSNNHKAPISNGEHHTASGNPTVSKKLKTQKLAEEVPVASGVVRVEDAKVLDKKLGFIGVGNMGSLLVRRLMASGRDLLLCSRSVKNEDNFQACNFVENPKQLFERSDIVFSCVSDCQDAKELLVDVENGALDYINSDKGYVELSSLDLETTLNMHKHVVEKGGRYLEAPLCGSLSDATDGKLVIMCAGDRSLFEELLPCFQVIGRKAFFLGAAGNATKVRLGQQMLNGSIVACVAETLAFADRCGLNIADFAELLEHTSVNSALLQDVARKISDEIYLPPSTRLNMIQKEMQYAISLANGQLCHPTPLASLASQLYLTVRNNGMGDNDCAAVYNAFIPHSNRSAGSER